MNHRFERGFKTFYKTGEAGGLCMANIFFTQTAVIYKKAVKRAENKLL